MAPATYLLVSCYYSRPAQYRPSVYRLPPNTAAHFQVPNKVFLGLYDSFHRRFPNAAAFSSVLRSAVLGGTFYITVNYTLNLFPVTCQCPAMLRASLIHR